MDLSAQYCPTRRDLEENGWWLVSRLSTLTGELLRLIGHDHAAFLLKKAQCRAARDEISESGRRLRRHRTAHGC